MVGPPCHVSSGEPSKTFDTEKAKPTKQTIFTLWVRKMVVTSHGEEDEEQIKPEYDRKSELKAFDDTKTGVKGLVDAMVTKIPRIFIHDKSQLNDISTTSSAASLFSVPIIDFEGVDQGSAQRAGIIEKVRDAWRATNWRDTMYCIMAPQPPDPQELPATKILNMIEVQEHIKPEYDRKSELKAFDDTKTGVKGLVDAGVTNWNQALLPPGFTSKIRAEVKKGFYTRDLTRKFGYLSKFDLYTGRASNWRDSINCFMAPLPPDPQELPAVCRYDALDMML
ncbi:hypothetical protein RHSIM_Rhsim04G0187100 [Rhododendron simsii]|uniref:Uncharacterized protein n=1 Tax=Rhododendron simsii TaxID=118357 RepID=A0A834H305_RHOSS|nr:hypothetical protein RHSIM_Rhsim04G0187100 [Rhododendron simsii]